MDLTGRLMEGNYGLELLEHSEIVAPFSVSGIRPNGCALVEPSRTLTEEYSVIVGHTLVDASSRPGSVLMVNPNGSASATQFYMCRQIGTSGGDFGSPRGSGLSERRAGCSAGTPRGNRCGISPFAGGLQLFQDLLFRYRHVFPAPGEPVTGRTTSEQHEILTSDARPVRWGPRRLAAASLRTEQTCVQEMLHGGQIEPSESPWASPVVFVTKKDGSTRFCVNYRRLDTLMTKDAYPLLWIDDRWPCLRT